MSSRRGFIQNLLAGVGIFTSVKALSAQETSMAHGREGILTERREKLPRRSIEATFRFLP